MKLQTIAVLSAATLSVALLAGCPTGTLPPGTGTTTPSILSGRITHGAADPGSELTLGLKKFDGAAYQKLGTTTKTDTKGNYAFTDASLASGKYQVIYDDGGQVMNDASVNTTGVYVSEAVEASSTATKSINFDVKWIINPLIEPAETFVVGTSSFGWAANTNAPGAEYQVFIQDAASASVFSSAFKTRTTLAWNGKKTSANDTDKDAPTGALAAAGQYYYQIKFQKAGTTYGGDGFYGQTKWIPFKI